MEGKGTRKPLKVLAIHTSTGSRFYRVIPQLRWMRKQGHEAEAVAHDDPRADELIEWADVVVLQMVFSAELVALIRQKGKKVIFECDDLIHRTHEKHYSYGETRGLWNQIRWLWRIWRVLRRCDGFIVTNERLRRVYGWMCRRTLVFPNYMELEHWLKEPVRNPTGRVRILWAGSTSHTGDLEWVKPIIGRILAKYPHVQFMYMGHGGVPTDDLYAKFVYGDDVFEGIPTERRESMLPAPPEVYPYVLSALMADIAIAPLERNYFNRFKTQCKYLEYAINGIPGVYSRWFYTDVKDQWDGHPDDDISGETTGLLADTPEEWEEALSALIEGATLRRQIGDNARREVLEKYSFSDHADRWQGFVEMIADEPRHPEPRSTPGAGPRQGGR
jgi:glycosyltransferase involved in cell wall biosynthesis